VLREKDEAAEERRLMAIERAQLEARRDELNALGERISKEALRQVAEQGLEIKSWADLERADKLGRRALGMGEDGADKKVALNVTLLEGGAGLIDRTPPTITVEG
jgi:vacuolar-type H+-ATPase subunit E/Vma4